MPRPVWRLLDRARLCTQATSVSEREERAQLTHLPRRILRHRQSSHGAALCLRLQCRHRRILLTTLSTIPFTTILLQSRAPVQSRSLPRHRSHSCRLQVLLSSRSTTLTWTSSRGRVPGRDQEARITLVGGTLSPPIPFGSIRRRKWLDLPLGHQQLDICDVTVPPLIKHTNRGGL